jgi:prevent-host-death family protein
MALTVSMTEAKRDFYELYDRVAAGEEVIITRWGKPVARMIRNADYRPDDGIELPDRHRPA